MQDIEIIAIDPNNFYTTSEEDGEDNEEDDISVAMAAAATINMNHQNGNLQLGVESTAPGTNFPLYHHHHSMAFDMQQSDDFDIITLNIDDDFPIDAEDDDLLFRNEHQSFDLANYIGGGSAGSECSSLLLTPVKDGKTVAASTPSPLNLRHKFLLPNAMYAEPMKIATATPNNINPMQSSAINISTAHVRVTKTPASNRRKRKNLSREFILESDDTSDTDSNSICNTVISNKINQMIDDRKANRKRKPIKESDPVWNPLPLKRNPPPKKSANGRKNAVAQVAQVDNLCTKVPAKHAGSQGKSLRNLIKQQLLSDRPINAKKLLKTTSSPSLPTQPHTVEKPNVTQVAHAPVHRIGVGRGKDIAITAKYYNRTESSDDDNSTIEPIEEVKSNKAYRYDQIYTDSDNSDMEIDVSSVPTTTVPDWKPKVHIPDQEKEPTVVKDEKCIKVAECKRKTVSKPQIDVKVNAMVEPPPIPQQSQSSGTNNPPKLTCNSKKTPDNARAVDSSEFVKALVVDGKTKVRTKSKSIVAAKRKKFEEQKRLIKSNILLQNPAKFKLLTTENATLTSTSPIAVDGATPISNAQANAVKSVKGVVEQSNVVKEKTTTELKPVQIVQPIKIESENTVNIENQKHEHETKHTKEGAVQNKEEDIKPDIAELTTTSADEQQHKNEANAKRKLNIQEYLQRKSLKATGQNGHRFVNSIKMEQSDVMKRTNSANAQSQNDGDAAEESKNGLAANSMYEEIIIVSIGCNTDISIPKTTLLSNIQTSVAEANAKISSSSLISSIQSVLLKQSRCSDVEQAKKERKISGPKKGKNAHQNGTENGTNAADDNGSEEVEEHGENKVIMHLRKDRVRPMRKTIAIQTDSYFQFPTLQKLMPATSRASKMLNEKSMKRVNSFPRDTSANRSVSDNHYMHSNGGRHSSVCYNRNRTYSNSICRGRLMDANHSGDEELPVKTQRPSRHSQFVERRHTERNYRKRYTSRNRSRSISSSSDSSSVSVVSGSSSLSSSSSSSATSTSSSTSKSSSSSSVYISNASPRSLNSYGGSSSKSYYDDHPYSRKRTTSNSHARRKTYRRHSNNRSRRSDSPGLWCSKGINFFHQYLERLILHELFSVWFCSLCLQRNGESSMLAVLKMI